MLDHSSPSADQLLVRLNMAVAAANEAEKTVSTAQTELVSRSKLVGTLLLEAKKLHPTVKKFEAFLKRVNGLKRSRAYDLMRLVGGRTTEEELKKDARDRQQKSRDSKKKQPLPTPKKPESVSVTGADVTETEKSALALAEFSFACRHYLPNMTEADRQKAYALVAELTEQPKAEAA